MIIAVVKKKSWTNNSPKLIYLSSPVEHLSYNKATRIVCCRTFYLLRKWYFSYQHQNQYNKVWVSKERKYIYMWYIPLTTNNVQSSALKGLWNHILQKTMLIKLQLQTWNTSNWRNQNGYCTRMYMYSFKEKKKTLQSHRTSDSIKLVTNILKWKQLCA